MNVAVIPARGGSKRIPGKNIKPFAGKPMLAWSILAAKASGLFERIIVSTDAENIAHTALEYGAEVPFIRPANLSDDLAPTAPVFFHALDWVAKQGSMPNYACCIYPTAPFIRAEDLRRGLDILKHSGAPGALSVTTFAFPILRAFKLENNGSVAFNWPEHEMTRSQDLPEFYHDAGQFYWMNAPEFMRQKRLIMPGTMPIVLPRTQVQDLDTPEDWHMAELMAKALGMCGETS